ncbi:uncharacterized protein LOC125956416 isoform X2 [Anopheles darlingi]|uniref:uncharacterized protein LOC125956416 isoform X2 n=1 Tax=Anopheles darlingi TaxID=43151 RepID=UPI0020FFF878|nr:uncharacterized protein LOC125956416 isoform X2 [Anopheles darlingi]XP_049544211.1 uncharacterized protein LOC125956416 isoform X2 [Anopheles darlingi]
METASERIRKRAEAALEIAKDLLDAEADEDEEDESEGEDCRSDDALEGVIDDTLDGDEATYSDQEHLSETETDKETMIQKHIKDAETSPEKRKWIKTLAGVIFRPIVSKFKWNLNVNLDVQASNHNKKSTKKNSKQNRNKPSTSEPTKEETGNKKEKSDDAVKIKKLTKENKRLVKLADIFLNECIDLKTKNEILSEEVEISRQELIDEKKDHDKKYQELVASTEKRIAEIKRSEAAFIAAHAALTKEVERSRQEWIDEKRVHEKKYRELVSTSEKHVAEIESSKAALSATHAELMKITQLNAEKTMELQRMAQDHTILMAKCNNLASELSTSREERNRIEEDFQQQLHKVENEKVSQKMTEEQKKGYEEKQEQQNRKHKDFFHLLGIIIGKRSE